MRHELIVGVEWRRFWPDEMKLSILQEVGVGGATVTDFACRHDLTLQHIYQWRRQLKDKGLWPEPEGTAFLALDAQGLPLTSKPEIAIGAPAEIGFANGRILRCPPGIAEVEYEFDLFVGTPTLLRENIWMDGRAVAVIEGGQVYLIRTDHIYRPVFATNMSGTVVWEAHRHSDP